MTDTDAHGTDARPSDPDELELVCRVCGEPFRARVGWQPICRSCWAIERECKRAGEELKR
jgi:hypothetical protein